MRSGGGVIIAVILGIILGFRALYQLFKMRRYLRFTIYILFWVGYPFLGYNLYFFIQHQEDVHTRLWIGMPAIFSSMMWLFFGLMMNKKVKNIKLGIDYKDKLSPRRRILGMFISVVAFFAWVGGFNSYFGESDGFDILGSFVVSLVFWFGTMYLVTGKPINRIDD